MSASSTPCALVPRHLKTEHRRNPMGIDARQPRLSWIPEPVGTPGRGYGQTAYRIIVATAPEKLDAGTPDLWDSGKTPGAHGVLVPFAGDPVPHGTHAFWRVRIWDNHGRESEWSETAQFLLGPAPDAWQADWIEEPDPLTFEGCSWVWTPGEGALERTTAGNRAFRKTLENPADDPVTEVHALLCGDGDCSLYLNGQEIAATKSLPNGGLAPVRVRQNKGPSPGTNVLGATIRTEGTGPAALTGRVVLHTRDGRQRVIFLDGTWKCALDPVEGWLAPGFDDSGWDPAAVVARVGQGDALGAPATPWGVPGRDDNLLLEKLPCFRREFDARPGLLRASLHVAARGNVDVYMNGARVSESWFDPGWPSYQTRTLYRSYDVTDSVRDRNALGILLADGWFAGYIAWMRIRNRHDADPCFRAQLVLTYEDGSAEVIGTGRDWQCGYGPWMEGDLQHGEAYDARREIDGWAEPGFDASGWVAPAISTQQPAPISANLGEPVRAIEELRPVSCSEPRPGVHVFDLGQNMVGVARLRVSGPRGTRVRLRFAEMLQEDGMLYTAALRGARAIDTYYLKGKGVEEYTPRTTFHGFRYVEVTGYPGRPGLDAITGVVLHSDCERAGTLTTSSPLVDQIYSNILWGQKGNYLEVPTDCPQRDERLGWTGDAQVFMRTGAYNMDIAAFFTKWIQDLFDDQTPEGNLPHVAPESNAGCGHGSAAWVDAGVVCPYLMWRCYGDSDIIRKHWAQMNKFMDFLMTKTTDFIREDDFCFGDWLNLNSNTPLELIGTAYLAYDARMMAELAEAIGENADAQRYRELFANVRKAFCQKFRNPQTGQLDGNAQTSYVLALEYGLLDDEMVPAAMQHLVRDLLVRDWHFSTGFVGIRGMMPTLSKYERNDVAYRLLLNDTFPSWGFEVACGATTIWERWDGYTPEFGFQDVHMNSFNHYAYGAVGEWMYGSMAGITESKPGFEEIVIAPQLGDGITEVRARHRTVRGDVVSEWKIKDRVLRMRIVVPAGCQARVLIPVRDGAEVLEGGLPLVDAAHVVPGEVDGGLARAILGPGHYEFTAEI